MTELSTYKVAKMAEERREASVAQAKHSWSVFELTHNQYRTLSEPLQNNIRAAASGRILSIGEQGPQYVTGTQETVDAFSEGIRAAIRQELSKPKQKGRILRERVAQRADISELLTDEESAQQPQKKRVFSETRTFGSSEEDLAAPSYAAATHEMNLAGICDIAMQRSLYVATNGMMGTYLRMIREGTTGETDLTRVPILKTNGAYNPGLGILAAIGIAWPEFATPATEALREAFWLKPQDPSEPTDDVLEALGVADVFKLRTNNDVFYEEGGEVVSTPELSLRKRETRELAGRINRMVALIDEKDNRKRLSSTKGETPDGFFTGEHDQTDHLIETATRAQEFN